MSARHLIAMHEAIVRIVHARGRVGIEELLTAYQARPLTVRGLRQILSSLVERGWLCVVRNPNSRRANSVAWMLTEEAVPHVLEPAPLPMRPGHVPQLHTPVAAPVPPPSRAYMRQTWVPPAAAPMRPGALDFLRCPSRGPFHATH